jgi:hypothetical protein
MTPREGLKKKCVLLEDGTVAFKKNTIIEDGLRGRLNDLYIKYQDEKYAKEWEELYQLVGYDLDSYCNLDYVSKKSKALAWEILQTWNKKNDT